jgi:hypothetical protein
MRRIEPPHRRNGAGQIDLVIDGPRPIDPVLAEHMMIEFVSTS